MKKGPSRITRLLKGFLALILIASGLYLLLPGRNVFGNPAFEREFQRCSVPGSGEVVRLYEGNGGATTAFWYTVTFDEGWLARERQIFFAYGSPEIKRVVCRGDAVDLVLEEGLESPEILPLEKIRRELQYHPEALSMGKTFRPVSNPLRLLSIGAGVLLLGVGVLVGIGLVRRMRPPDCDAPSPARGASDS